MSRSPSPIRNALTHWGGFGINALVGFFLAPVVVRELGDSAYGIWVLLASLLGYLGLLDLGVRGAVMRFVARSHAQGDHRSASSIASTAVAIFSLTGLAALFISCVVAAGIQVFFHSIPGDLVGYARIALILGGAAVAVSLVGGVYGGVIGGLQRFDLSNSLGLGLDLVRAAAVYVAVKAGYGIVALAAIQLGVSTARAALHYGIARRLYPELGYRFGLIERHWVGTIFSYGAFSVAIQASGALISQADSIVIAALLPVSQVTAFSIGATLVQQSLAITRGVTFMIPPMVSALQAKGATESIRRMALRAARLLSLMLVPVAATFILRGESFIGLWMGPQYSEVSGRVLDILALRMWLSAGFGVFSMALYGLNRHRVLVPYYIAEAVANLVLSVALARPLGVVGVALGTLIPAVLTYAWLAPRIYKRELGIGLGVIAREIWGRAWVAVLPFILATWAFEHYAPASGLLQFFAQVAAALPLAAAGAWLFALDPEDKDVVRTRLGLRVPSPS